jgi:hypothetical protein
MRPVVPTVGLLIVVAAMTVSSCASSGSANSAAASESVVAVSSPAAGSASTIQVSSSASTVQVSSPAPACPAVAGWPSVSRSPAAADQLFVAGAPTLATLCQYMTFTANGSSLPPPVLVQISGPALTDLVASLNALAPTKDEPPCPAPMQSDVLVFVGAGSPSTVRLDLKGGCDFVWSDTGVHAYATTALLQQLTAIVATAAGASSPAAGSSRATVAVGDAAAVSKCQAAENAEQAPILAAGGTTPALTVAAGFTTTEGDAHRYADSIGLRPGDPSPRPADSSSSYTNTTPVVTCILDGYIPAPNLPGNPPYSREFALIGPSGTLDLLVAGRTDTISLQNPSSPTP